MAEIDDADRRRAHEDNWRPTRPLKHSTVYPQALHLENEGRLAYVQWLSRKESAIAKVVKATLSAYMEAQAEEAAAADED